LRNIDPAVIAGGFYLNNPFLFFQGEAVEVEVVEEAMVFPDFRSQFLAGAMVFSGSLN